MAKKEYRRHIRIGGKMKKSPKGLSKVQADLWYQRLYEQRVAMNGGVYFVSGAGPTLNEYFDDIWFPRRKKGLKSTWASDEQRYKDYVKPELGRMRLNQINMVNVRNCLRLVTEKHGMSSKTRTRVQALLSKIFKDAFNEPMPLVNANPVSGIRFDDAREGKREPPHFKKEADIKRFLKAAKDLSLTHLTYAVLAMGAGLRKSEISALTWKDWDDEEHFLSINKRLIQASNEIVSGTKSGSKEGRHIPISDEVSAVLMAHYKSTGHSKHHDFILSKNNGKHFGPRDIARLNQEICEESKLKINPHGLRHSFGRLYAKETGNLKALQAILGHSSSAVTDIYSELSGTQIKGLRNAIKIGVKND